MVIEGLNYLPTEIDYRPTHIFGTRKNSCVSFLGPDMTSTLNSKSAQALILLIISSLQNCEAKECYRCKNAQTFSSNLTTSLLPLNPGKPCVLEPIRCAEGENSCVYGLVSVVVAGGFWFHLSGCYVETINETHCFRGAGPVNWPGYTAELRANYCLCGGKGESDLCNDSRFAKAVVTYNLYNKNPGGGFFSHLPNGSSLIKNRAAADLNVEQGGKESNVSRACTKTGQYFSLVVTLWALVTCMSRL